MTLMEVVLVLTCIQTQKARLKDREEISEIKEYYQIYQECSYLEELTQTEWSINKKKRKKNEELWKLKLKVRNTI